MKKTLLITLCSLATLGTQAQVNIQEWNGGNPTGPSLNGTTIQITANDNELVVVDLSVKNTSGLDKYYQIKRTRILETVAWRPTEQICWGYQLEGSCYPTNAAQTSWTSPMWSSPLPNDAAANLKFDIHTSTLDKLHFRFYVVENGNYVDSVDVFVNQSLSLQNNKKDNAQINVYPNPSTNFIAISGVEDLTNVNVRITDVLGKVVLNEAYSGKIDVADFKNGVYLVTVFSNGQMIQTRRVVVKH